MIALASHAAQAAAAATAEGGDASSPSPPPSQLASATSSSSSWRNRLSLSAIGGSLGGALIGGGGARHLPASAAGWLLVRRHGAPGSGRKQHASWGQQFVVLRLGHLDKTVTRRRLDSEATDSSRALRPLYRFVVLLGTTLFFFPRGETRVAPRDSYFLSAACARA